MKTQNPTCLLGTKKKKKRKNLFIHFQRFCKNSMFLFAMFYQIWFWCFAVCLLLSVKQFVFYWPPVSKPASSVSCCGAGHEMLAATSPLTQIIWDLHLYSMAVCPPLLDYYSLIMGTRKPSGGWYLTRVEKQDHSTGTQSKYDLL